MYVSGEIRCSDELKINAMAQVTEQLQDEAWRFWWKALCRGGHTLDRQFATHAPDRAWVKDIPYLHTHEGFAYLCVVIDLFSRRVVGWVV